KLFLVWAVTVLIPLAAIAWPLTRALRQSSERGALASFAGTSQSLASVQAARVSRMRQAGVLVMNIPELRALVAESNVELDAGHVSSLRERLDYLAGQLDVRFMCLLDSGGQPIAQNSDSPWRGIEALDKYSEESAQMRAMVRRLYADRGQAPK